jgi:hypothetical protein
MSRTVSGCEACLLRGSDTSIWSSAHIGRARSHAEMLRVLHETGFAVEALHACKHQTAPLVARSWGRRWPCEDVWHARKLESRTASPEP